MAYLLLLASSAKKISSKRWSMYQPVRLAGLSRGWAGCMLLLGWRRAASRRDWTCGATPDSWLAGPAQPLNSSRTGPIYLVLR